MNNDRWLAAHWGFRIRACRPYRAKTESKIERPIHYVRGNFLYGREFLGDADLAPQAEHWCTGTANQRAHGTTHEAPQLRFERDERSTLLPWPCDPTSRSCWHRSAPPLCNPPDTRPDRC